jgi:hypothetical protein
MLRFSGVGHEALRETGESMLRSMSTRVTVLVAGFSAIAATALPSFAERGGPEVASAAGPSGIAIDQVRDAAATVSLYKEPGFGKVTVDLDAREVDVHWKGDPPEAVTNALGRNENGVVVRMIPVKYSDAELLAAAERIMYASLEPGAIRISSVSRFPDMAGLTAKYSPRRIAEARSAAIATGTTLSAELTGLAGVPVTTAEGLPVTTGLTRQNDSPPWQGGGAIEVQANGGYCSTGFSMVTASGQGRLLTAAHCDLTANSQLRDGSNNATSGVITPGGAAVDRAADLDSLLIDPEDSPGSIGKVFGGPWNAGTGHSRYQFHVGGWTIPHQGDAVCFSGAMSGEHCTDKTILETGGTFWCPRTVIVCEGFRSGGGGTVTATAGDSGGPVYSPRSGSGRMWARGIISAEVPETQELCPSVADPDRVGNRCYRQVWSIGIHRLIDHWAATSQHAGLTVEIE